MPPAARSLRLCLALLLAAASAASADLASGDRAPDFELQGTDGRRYALSDFAGRRELVLAWFPKAFTPG